MIGNTLFVFDILSMDAVDFRNRTTVGRYATYQSLLRDADVHYPALQPVEGYFTTEDKKNAFDEIKGRNGEGVVFKEIHAPYEPGRPNSGGSQLKFKFTESSTCIVHSVSDSRRSVGIALLDTKGIPIAVGNVTVPVNQAIPEEGDLVEVRYLYMYQGGSLFQPVLLGTRDDVARVECTLSQVRRIKPKESDEALTDL